MNTLVEEIRNLEKKILQINEEADGRAILYIVDGLGYNSYQKAKKDGAIVFQGKAKRVRAPFPTSTAPNVASIHTAKTNSEHGIPEMVFFDKEKDASAYAFTLEPTTENASNWDEYTVYEGDTVYERLARKSITCAVILPKGTGSSPYTRAFCKGATVYEYGEIGEIVSIIAKIEATAERTYVVVHFFDVDSVMHKYGTESEQAKNKIRSVFSCIEKINKKNHRSIIAATADHGLLDVDGGKRIFLDRHPEIVNKLAKTAKGDVVWPTGGVRAAILHVQKGKIVEMLKTIKKLFPRQLRAYSYKQACEKGLLKQAVNKRNRHRFGDVLLIPTGRNIVWHEQFSEYPLNYQAYHGGTANKESIVPFILFKTTK